MNSFDQVNNWLAAGKQIGRSFSFERQGFVYWSSVGVQKWRDGYKVYIDEILESKMDAEEYEKELVVELQNIEDIDEFIKNNSLTSLANLTPCKGQKIFNPDFN